jgi:integrase
MLPLPLGDYELTIFLYVMDINKEYGYSDQDFIFCDTQGRTKIREIDNRIRKLCNKADIEVKSAQDIRRTVASELFNNGVPVEIIRNYLGHSDIKTTWGYILDNHRKEETTKMILKSLENLNVLKRTQAS